MARTTHEARFLLTAKDQTRRVFRSVRGNVKGLAGAVTGLHSKVLGLAGIAGVGFLAKGLIDVNAEFQTIKSSLKTVTGGTKEAADAFALIEKFAVTTPFDLQQVTQSFIKLKALGLDPSEEALESYGNTASAMGKSLDQMIEAVADAATGEFERLKEFGIRASKQNDEVAFTFQGVTKTVADNSAAIQGYLRSIGDVNFAGAMNDQMGNLIPAFSNFGMAVDGLAIQIGEAGLNKAISETTNMITELITSADPEEIQEFTRSALMSFADLLEGVDSAYRFISGNSHLQAMGIIGYLLFGKAGVAIAAVVDQANTAMARDLAKNWDFLNPSDITGGQSSSDLGGYQLGDFNRTNPAKAATFDDWKRAIVEGGQAAEPDPRVDTTNRLLQDIAERIRENLQQPAVAG